MGTIANDQTKPTANHLETDASMQSGQGLPSLEQGKTVPPESVQEKRASGTPASADDYLVDKAGRRVEGLPTFYDNIDERGNVSYLDEQRRQSHEHWEKNGIYKNHPNGIGFKNFCSMHFSARPRNWEKVLGLFRKIVDWSAYMKKPKSLRSRIYKRLVLFDPIETRYSYGAVYNLNVDADFEAPGTRAYEDKLRAEHKTDAYSVTGTQVKHAHDEGREKCNVMPQAIQEAQGTKRRTIELGETVFDDVSKTTIPIDLVKQAIMGASYIGGMKECICRAGEDCQNYPHDLACLFLNRVGKVVVDHGVAVEMSKEEALARVDQVAELGLTCQTMWTEVEQLIWGFRNDEMDSFLEVCFCCPCCCVGFNLSKNATRDVKHRFSPTGWTAVVDHDACIGCKTCLDDYCPQDAVHFRASDGKMVVDQKNCVGCGICRSKCPHDAISIKQTMPMRDSIHHYYYEEGMLDIVPGRGFEDHSKSAPVQA